MKTMLKIIKQNDDFADYFLKFTEKLLIFSETLI